MDKSSGLKRLEQRLEPRRPVQWQKGGEMGSPPAGGVREKTCLANIQSNLNLALGKEFLPRLLLLLKSCVTHGQGTHRRPTNKPIPLSNSLWLLPGQTGTRWRCVSLHQNNL